MIRKIKHKLSKYLFSLKETEPETAYDIWSGTYDLQPDNLMLALDEDLFSDLIKDISFENKVIVDVGCGTGRHWKSIYTKQPQQLIGYDVSKGMLTILQQKYPGAKAHLLKNELLEGLEKKSCDILISTLAIAHMENMEACIAEWDRVIKPGAKIILTDYHPDALSKGGNRTFSHKGKNIAIKNYVHTLEKIRTLFSKFNFEEYRFFEKKIDESVKHYFEKQQALHVYEQFKETPIIYGIYLSKGHASL